MLYDPGNIKFKNIPILEKKEDGTCCRTYIYTFKEALPEQNILNQIAERLKEKFHFSKEIYSLPEDIEVIASVSIQRFQERQAKVMVVESQPAEVCVYLFSLRTLPTKLESELGAIQSIQNQPREMWIY